ncbi:TVP38/TMEM64 family protein [Vibrio vulnificus]|uniref:TVP38/TMEM64 family membrane protein n=1 Tax=Vibrio vulnificus TaxID=672 RepID=A0ABX4WVD9_VIBVL|nr:TVP38/TMEM64 family protein [Vibrio vulnificus]ASM97232.1 dihydrolipoamide dehydrogenase [Vibrio vulnificus NBRC 15645 = ATCC 27562]AVW98659.1 TVP38/TMEM64 family protein [Vibrio vulnificus Env1]EGQ7930148.1 TVP38/TMEM64 family protein [Vibrio vulnificus]EGQ7950519.1 TVP38/TMEM64 family protein [Vibrio vulnificus]EGQ7982810.1 TVP38/TMEM64 family protein [Vibrio vulnificus]
MNKKLVFGILLIATIILLAVNFSQYLTLDNAKAQQLALNSFIEENFLFSSISYFVIYVGLTAFSVPGATVVTLLGAALFGFWYSLLLVSFASTIGATIAFLSSRYLLKDWVQARFGDKLSAINQGVEKDGAFYLFSLRLIPVFPFFLINLLMGLTPISIGRYYLTSQIGMLPGTAVYLNAGTQLADINSLSGILSPTVLASFALLGVFPIAVKWIMSKFRPQLSS